MTNAEFGNRVRELRKQLKLTQLELSMRCELQQSYIGSLELGKKNPTLETMQSIADGFGISLDELIGKQTPNLKKFEGKIDNAISYLMSLDDDAVEDAITVFKIMTKYR